MSRFGEPSIVVCGVTGDLARHKLLPALEALGASGELPSTLTIIGTTRRAGVTVEEVAGELPFVKSHLTLVPLDPEDQASYQALAEVLTGEAERIFYFSVPVNALPPLVRGLGQAGLLTKRAKLLIEKPFGRDLVSAEELETLLLTYVHEEQIYRVDHYLAKRLVTLLPSLRAQSPWREWWSGSRVERVEICARESVGVSSRARFYDETGALRDVIQSHLLELVAVTLMSLDEHASPTESRRDALKSLSVSRAPARRGQYRGYREEIGESTSITETYAELELESNLPEWSHVSIRLLAGKALSKKETTITLHLRDGHSRAASQLVVTLQPTEKITLSATEESANILYEGVPNAHQEVLRAALQGEHAIFVSIEEVRELWRVVDPILARWERDGNDLILYEKGAEEV